MSQVGAAMDHSRGDPTGMKSNTFVVFRGLGSVCSCSIAESKLTTTEGISEKATFPLPFPGSKLKLGIGRLDADISCSFRSQSKGHRQPPCEGLGHPKHSAVVAPEFPAPSHMQ